MAMSVVYTTIDGVLVHEERGGVERQYVGDPLGSLVGELDENQNLTYTAEYWPYGEVRTESGNKQSEWGFVGLLGYLKDLATLLYVRARHYVPQKARWLTVDPRWPWGSAYRYVANCPISNTDRTGLGECENLRDSCLDSVDDARNWCVHLAHMAHRKATDLCRKLAKVLQPPCFLEAFLLYQTAAAACFTIAGAAQLKCLEAYVQCLAAKAIAVVVIIAAFVIALTLLCKICPICCAVPIFAIPAIRNASRGVLCGK